jgi:hypothetical protein
MYTLALRAKRACRESVNLNHCDREGRRTFAISLPMPVFAPAQRERGFDQTDGEKQRARMPTRDEDHFACVVGYLVGCPHDREKYGK